MTTTNSYDNLAVEYQMFWISILCPAKPAVAIVFETYPSYVFPNYLVLA